MRAPWSLLPLLAISFAAGCDGGAPTETRVPEALQPVSAAALAGTVGSTLAAPLAVQVLDDRGKGMRGVTVAWSVTAGGGSMDPATSITDASGVAVARWTLGTGAGTQEASAAAGELAPVAFTAAASPDAAAAAAPVGGNGQSGEVAGALPDSLVVRVADRYGNPVPNVAVAWSVSAGGGTLAPGGTATNDSGLVKARWTLGPAIGAQSVEARAAGVTDAHAQFRATAEGRPGSVTLAASAGDAQTGTVGRPVAGPLAVRAVDRQGRAVVGLAVAWEVTEGAGSLAPATTTTDSAGIARTLWTLGPRVGPNTARATAAGASVLFRATSAAGPAAGVFAVSGDGQSGVVGGALPAPSVVRVADAHGNPVAGAAVDWTVSAGGGTVSPAAARTDAAGLARATWTLGTVPGSNTLQARTVEAPGSLAVFHATASPGPPAALGKVAGDGQSGPAGNPLPAALAVRLTDRYGNPLGGVAVAWSATAGGGSMDPASASTNPEGIASARWVLGTATIRQAAGAAVGGLASAPFGATATSGVEVAALKVTPSTPTMQVGTRLPLSVAMVDAAGEEIGPWPGGRWLSQDPTVAQIEAVEGQGYRVLAVGPGTATITASMSGKFGTLTVTVVDRDQLGSDDFRSNTLGSYTAHSGAGGTWTMGNGALVGSGVSGNALLTRNGVSLADGWVETVIYRADDAGLVFRLQGDGRYYLLAIRHDVWPYQYQGRTLELFRMGGLFAVPLGRYDLTWLGSAPRTIRLQAVGSTLRVFVDGRLAFTAEDSGIQGPGGLGVRHRGESAASTNQFLSLRWGTP
jgi:hypothetical protein